MQLHCVNTNGTLYNTKLHPVRSVDISEVCATAGQDRVIIGGDFNANFPFLSSSRRTYAAITYPRCLSHAPISLFSIVVSPRMSVTGS